MKKLLVIFVLGLLITSCDQTNVDEISVKRTNELGYDLAGPEETIKYDVIIIDSCEYLIYKNSNDYKIIVHKGNCKFCTERRKKEIKECLNEIKE